MQNYQKPPTNPILSFVIRHCKSYGEKSYAPFSIFYEAKTDPYACLHEIFVDAELIAEFYPLELIDEIDAQLHRARQTPQIQLDLVACYHSENNRLNSVELAQMQEYLPTHFPESALHIQVINPAIPWDAQFGEGFFVSGMVWNKGVSGYGVTIHEVLFEDQDVSAAFARGNIATHLFSDSLVSAYEEHLKSSLTKDDIEMYQVALKESMAKASLEQAVKVA